MMCMRHTPILNKTQYYILYMTPHISVRYTENSLMNITFKGRTRIIDFQLYPDGKVGIVFGRHGNEENIEMSCNLYKIGQRMTSEGEVYVRTWNECEGAVEALVEAGIVEKVGWREKTGYVYAELCKFTEKAMEEIRKKFKWPTPTATEDVQKLIDVLKKINDLSDKELPPAEYIWGSDDNVEEEEGIQPSKHPLVNEAQGLACEFFITDDGRCNFPNMKVAEQAGFRVFAGEKDSFGWLTGCIQTNKGIIVYG